MVRQIKDEIADIPLQKLTTPRLQRMVNDWAERGTKANRGPLAARTIRKMWTCLSAALNRAVDLDLLHKNPAKKVTLPRMERAEMHTLDMQQAQDMLAKVKSRGCYIPVLLALTTGMRRGEIIGLRWDDVDLKNGRVTP